MRITAGMGASACLALALAGCANKYGVERIDYPVAYPAAQPIAVQPAVAARPVHTGACPAVAVMPFIGIDDDPACGYAIADIMADELLNCAGCQIMAPDAVTAGAGIQTGEDWDPVETGRRVGAPYILTGRVTDYVEMDDETEPMVGVAVRLIETRTGNVVWTGDGSKAAASLPEGGIAVLASEVCGDLAHDLHGKLDKNATVPDSEPMISIPPPMAAKAAVTSEPMAIESDPVPIPAAKASSPDIGEGTADWAIPLEEMEKYLERSERERPQTTQNTTAPDSAATATETVSSIFGNEDEEDMVPGTVLVPGAVTITFANEDIRPDEFGIQSVTVSNHDIPDAGAIEPVAFVETPEHPSTVPTPEAAGTLDMTVDEPFSPKTSDTSILTVGADTAPSSSVTGLEIPAAESGYPSTLDAGTDESEGRSPEGFSTQFTMDYTLELDGDSLEPARFDTPVDDTELDFFGKLSDSLFEELGDS